MNRAALLIGLCGGSISQDMENQEKGNKIKERK